MRANVSVCRQMNLIRNGWKAFHSANFSLNFYLHSKDAESSHHGAKHFKVEIVCYFSVLFGESWMSNFPLKVYRELLLHRSHSNVLICFVNIPWKVGSHIFKFSFSISNKMRLSLCTSSHIFYLIWPPPTDEKAFIHEVPC